VVRYRYHCKKELKINLDIVFNVRESNIDGDEDTCPSDTSAAVNQDWTAATT